MQPLWQVLFMANIIFGESIYGKCNNCGNCNYGKCIYGKSILEYVTEPYNDLANPKL